MTPSVIPDDPLAPISGSERIVSLDTIRALALFGVLLMNIPNFSGASALATLGKPVAAGLLDAWISGLTKILVSGKAMSCFAMLFGIGLFIQFDRAEANGISPGRFALRRLGGLLLIGIAHRVLVWEGDVLSVYALVGFALLPLVRSRPRTFLFVGLGAFALSDALFLLLRVLHAPAGLNTYHWAEATARVAEVVYGQGSWLSATAWRLSMWGSLEVPAHYLASIPFVMPLFMVGAMLWRLGIPKAAPDQGPSLSAWFHRTFWIGLALSILAADPLKLIPELWKKAWEGMPWLYFSDTGAFLLAIGYFIGLLRLLARPRWASRLSVLAPMGRMALTNYLTQSLVWTWIFYRQGLGLWGKAGPTTLLLCTLAFYALQVAWSRWWLARFKFGPAEWLWRSMTYGKWQPFRLERCPRSTTAESASELA